MLGDMNLKQTVTTLHHPRSQLLFKIRGGVFRNGFNYLFILPQVQKMKLDRF